MAASIRKWECYFATLIIVEFARVSRLIERDFSRDGGEFMDPFPRGDVALCKLTTGRYG